MNYTIMYYTRKLDSEFYESDILSQAPPKLIGRRGKRKKSPNPSLNTRGKYSLSKKYKFPDLVWSGALYFSLNSVGTTRDFSETYLVSFPRIYDSF